MFASANRINLETVLLYARHHLLCLNQFISSEPKVPMATSSLILRDTAKNGSWLEVQKSDFHLFPVIIQSKSLQSAQSATPHHRSG
jgi:hypothetical protein